MMEERVVKNAKQEEIKMMLEKQVELGEKRAAEQDRITQAREKLLELKLKELQLQKAKLVRKKREQEERDRATNDFMEMIDNQLLHMEAVEAKQNILTDAKPTVSSKKQSEIVAVKEAVEDSEQVVKEPVIEEETTPIKEEIKTPEPEQKNNEELKEAEKLETGAIQKNKKSKGKGRNRSKSNTPSIKTKVKSPEPSKPAEDKIKLLEPEQIQAQEQPSESHKKSEEFVGKKLSEQEVKDMVAKVEGKCQNMRGDIADMALSEQYLRTKQALLMSKKKEQEMKIAQKMATIREDEVAAMKEKVHQMQV